MGDLVRKWKSHGDYAAGYADAFNGHGFTPDGADLEPYQTGFDAGMRAVKMFEGVGFEQTGYGLFVKFNLVERE